MKRTWKIAALGLVIVFAQSVAMAAEKGLKFVETADGTQSSKTRELVQWTHSRLVFHKELRRVAVGQENTLQVEVLDNNEVLALAKNVGRTSIMIWYTDGTTENFLFSVIEDLSVLRKALRDIHPAVRIELAPDRAALVLRGQVPTIEFRIAAETAARNYLDVASGGAGSKQDIVMQAPAATSLGQDANFQLRSALDSVTSARNSRRKGATIINLIKVEQLPESLTEKLSSAIQDMGGKDVKVSRIQNGEVENNLSDTLLLSGEVETQVDLVRILNVASRLFVGESTQGGTDDIRAITNEAGGLLKGNSTGGQIGGQLGSGSSLGNGRGLDNNIQTNIGRSKMISVAGGRILSTIEVRDLPQVRVSVQMHEVSRRRLENWRPDMTLVSNGYENNGTFGLAGRSQRGANASQVENALQILGGSLVNNLQIGGSEMALDLLFSLLEEEGISRTVSKPTLTVLAGESAVFRAGGEVPVPKAFASSGLSSDDTVGANTSGVFSGTEFKSFGVELEVRAMVGENDRITLDMRPTISLPDTQLTQEIAGSTGSDLTTAAFNVRTIKTSARLEDGQALVIGGLVSRDTADNKSHTPGLSSVPLLGNLAKSSSDSDSDRELIIIVTPTIIREVRHDTSLWQFPSSSELLDWAVSVPHREAVEQRGNAL